VSKSGLHRNDTVCHDPSTRLLATLEVGVTVLLLRPTHGDMAELNA
jgi:hypothetical protein